jgi:hypothetical protein
MPDSSLHLDQLRDAVRKELSDEELRANRCDRFLAQIIRYQNGQGTLPDEQQFLLWREDLKKTVAVGALKAGMDLTVREAPPSDRAPTATRGPRLSGRVRLSSGTDSPAL